MTPVTPRTDDHDHDDTHVEPGHVVVFSHPTNETTTAPREGGHIPMPHFESPEPANRR